MLDYEKGTLADWKAMSRDRETLAEALNDLLSDATEDGTGVERLAEGVFKRAAKGNVEAAEFIRDAVGERALAEAEPERVIPKSSKYETLSPYAQWAWNRLCESYEFRPCDEMALGMLCEWYAIADECEKLIMRGDGKRKVIAPDAEGNPHVYKAVSALQMAQASVAALNKQLGIEAGSSKVEQAKEKSALDIAKENRESRMKLLKRA